MNLWWGGLRNLESYFKFPWICFSYLLKNRKTKTHGDNVLVIKLFGMGSIVKLAALCDEFNVDKSRVTLLTQSRFNEICLLLGFTQCLFIRLDGFWNLIKDCFEVLYQIPKADRKSTRLNSSHQIISYAVFCLKKKKNRSSLHNTI